MDRTNSSPRELDCEYYYEQDFHRDDPNYGESNSESKDEKVFLISKKPDDKYNFVFLTFFLLGLGVLLPWNFFITANDYWMYKFRDVNSTYDPNRKSTLQTTFTSYLAIANYLPFIAVLFVNAAVSHKISERVRILGSLLLMFIIFIIITILVEVNTDTWQKLFFGVIMINVLLISVACAVFQAGVTGIASDLPVKYMYSFMIGQAVAGILASLAQILSLLNHMSATKSALEYFISAVVCLILIILSYITMQGTEFYQYHTKGKYQEDKTAPPILDNISANITKIIGIILRRVWIQGASVLIVFLVSLSVFPAVCVLVVSENYKSQSVWTDQYFLPICCFLLFNTADFTGRIVCKWIPMPASWDWQLLFLSCLRVVYIPLFMLCNAQPRSHLPVLFGDVSYIILMVTMGVTNGYFSTLAMMYGPLKVGKRLREIAGFVLATLLGVGLTFGSLISYALVKLL